MNTNTVDQTVSPCPECTAGKHQNCTDVVPDGDDFDNLIDCACASAGHGEPT